MNARCRLWPLLIVVLGGVFSVQLNAAVFISEFLAENDGGLHDSDGDSPGWIELYNDSAADVNLAGWRLTDQPTDFSRWTFPATNLPAAGYLVVFASGKNRTVAGQELHTSFQLDNAGQYLALVQPDGTIAQAYDPAYPAQRRNVSFGILGQATSFSLVSTNAKVRWLVPTNGSLGLGWTTASFNDIAWAAGTNALGYDRDKGATNPGPVVLALDFNERGAAPVTQAGFSSFLINSNVNNATIQTNPTTRAYGAFTLTLSNTAPDGYDDRVRATPASSGDFTLASLLQDFVFSRETTSTGGLDLTVTGLTADQGYVATLWSFDSGSPGKRVSDWYANGSLVKSNYTFDGNVLPVSDSDDAFSFYAKATSTGALVISGRRSTNSAAASPAVFIDGIQLSKTGYGAQIATDLESAMYNRNASVCLRLPFLVTNLSAFNHLLLNVRYDDGFVAYINGQPVASRNAPTNVAYNSAATASHIGVEFESIPINLTPGLLLTGTNMLAIQGLNVAPNDLDFFLQAELVAQQASNTATRYFWPPSPGQPNSDGYLGFVVDTKFSANRGFYDTPFAVTITCATPGSTIYWTTNGSVPSPTSEALLGTPIPVNHTLAIRAVAYAPNLIPTEVETHSYIFLQQVLNQPGSQPGYPTTWQASYPADYGLDPAIAYDPVYGATISNDFRAIPTFSVVMSQADLWDPAIGIYPNPTSIGDTWERVGSIELINPNGSTEFAVNCGISIHGGASRDNARTPKHAFSLSFKSSYGPARLRYNWFDDPVQSFNTIVLRGMGFCDAWPTRYSDTSPVPGANLIGLRYRPESATYLKDPWIKQTMSDMGYLATHFEFAHVYLNGLYWGLMNPSERIDASFATSHLGGREMDWDVMAGDETYSVAELRDGFRDDWDQLIGQVNAGITNTAAYQAVLQKIDVDNLIDYMMVHAVSEMEDWPTHNWYSAHRRETNGIPGTKWIFMPWDQEVGMDPYVRRDRVNADADNTPARIYTKLRAWPEFRRLYGDHVQKNLFHNGALTASNCVARFERLAARIHDALVPESARWGDARKFAIGGNPGTGVTFTRDGWWIPEMQQLYSNYFGNLEQYYLNIFRTNGLYPLTGPPEFSQFGGAVLAGFALSMSHTNVGGSIYYTTDGSDPRQYGTALVSPTALSYVGPVPINTATLLSARVLDNHGWSALVQAPFFPPQDLSRLVLTELMYNPTYSDGTDGDEFEFLELKNMGTDTFNLSGLSFTQGIEFNFTNGTLLAPGAFFVLVRNPAAFSARYPAAPVNGIYTGKLDNNGETLTLSYATGTKVFSLTWGNRAPWPAAAGGFGFSLVPRVAGAFHASDNGSAWRASFSPGGSPGADDPEPAIPPIVINEILAHTDLPQLDAIELYNPTGTNVAIGGWFLTDDPSVPFKYRIPPETSISPYGLITFDAGQFNAFPGTPTNFLLSSAGDQAYLFSANTNGQLTGYSHGVDFGASFNGVSFGRVLNEIGEEFYPLQVSVTLGQPNSGPRIGPVVINEVHYHPEPGGCEFIELLNTAATNVPLFSTVFPTNTWHLKGVSFTFPTNVTIEPNGLLLVTATNPAAFRALYNVPSGVPILGPFTGELQNDGENIQLEAPDTPNTNGVPYVSIEELRYNDRAPWPQAADGSGLSLQRRNPAGFANSPANWLAAAPTPGRLLASADTDGDCMPDVWEIQFGTNPLVPDADQDPDGDGLTNLEEYLAGTDPLSAQSALKLAAIVSAPGSLTLKFLAISNRSYSVEYSTAISDPTWLNLTNLAAQPTNCLISIPQSAIGETRFYRLVTPALP